MSKKKKITQGMQLFLMNANNTMTPIGAPLPEGSSPETWATKIKGVGKFVCLPFLEITDPNDKKPVELGQMESAMQDDFSDEDDD